MRPSTAKLRRVPRKGKLPKPNPANCSRLIIRTKLRISKIPRRSQQEAHTHSHTLAHTHTCTCTHSHAHTHTHTYTHMHTHSHAMHAHANTRTHIQCTHIHAHTHMHTHTHTHPYTIHPTHKPIEKPDRYHISKQMYDFCPPKYTPIPGIGNIPVHHHPT